MKPRTDFFTIKTETNNVGFRVCIHNYLVKHSLCSGLSVAGSKRIHPDYSTTISDERTCIWRMTYTQIGHYPILVQHILLFVKRPVINPTTLFQLHRLPIVCHNVS